MLRRAGLQSRMNHKESYRGPFGRKTVGSKKRNITATTTAAIARMNAHVANLANMMQR
jgi:hypothetical protein